MFVVQEPKSDLCHFVVQVSRYTITYTHTHAQTRMHARKHTHDKTPLNERLVRRRVRYVHYRQHTQKTDMQTSAGFELRSQQ